MSDELKRAMEALEAAIPSLGSTHVGRRITTIETEHARTILAALRERDAAVEQARKDEREACRLIAKMGHEEECDCLVCHDVAAAIRARGAR